MRMMSAVFALLCLIGFSASAAPGGQQPRTEGAPTVDDVLKAVRADLQGSRADIMSKNLTLTAEQAAKFWPLFDKYQKEQNVIMDEHMRAIQTFVNSLQSLDDAAALALLNGHFDRDTRMKQSAAAMAGRIPEGVADQDGRPGHADRSAPVVDDAD
jgi:Spy/CpxP family protein refolding chaperone